MSVVTTNDFLKLLLERAISDSPTRSKISKFRAGKSQAEPSVTDSDLTSKVEFDVSTGYDKTFETSYPSLDTSLIQLSARGIIGDTQCNGESINGVAVMNTDSTPLPLVIGTFSAIAKTENVRIIPVFKIKARQTIQVT